jgi:hypothetical protein
MYEGMGDRKTKWARGLKCMYTDNGTGIKVPSIEATKEHSSQWKLRDGE